MIYFEVASQDASIYKIQPTQNTGLDEILEVSKTYIAGNLDIAHVLIKFDLTDISASITSGAITVSAATLNLKQTAGEFLPVEFSLYAYPVASSWDMGIGTKFDEISTEGATWENRTSAIDWDITGSDFNPTPSGSEDYSYLSTDVEMDVLDIVNYWLSGSVNNGLVLKHLVGAENDSVDYGAIQFFSKETNTIYQPKLSIGWDDSTFVTGSLTELISDDIHITFKSLKTKYKLGNTNTIRLVGREKYPLKSYVNQYGYTDIQYLPLTTYYQIKDAVTHEITIPFSDNTKVSCDATGNFFKLNFSNWEISREYYIEIKVVKDGNTNIFSDDDLTFVVEK